MRLKLLNQLSQAARYFSFHSSINPLFFSFSSNKSKSKAWAELSESITGGQADNFNQFMDELWDGDKRDRYKAAELFLKTMEFFRPKMSRVMGVVDTEMIIEVRHVESVKG